jgi:hypothetical protein
VKESWVPFEDKMEKVEYADQKTSEDKEEGHDGAEKYHCIVKKKRGFGSIAYLLVGVAFQVRMYS